MPKKHAKHLAYYLAIHFKNHPEKFYDLSIEKQVALLWNTSIEIELIKEIYKSDKFIPKVQDLAKDSYTSPLEKSLDEQMQQLDHKNMEILTLNNQVKSL